MTDGLANDIHCYTITKLLYRCNARVQMQRTQWLHENRRGSGTGSATIVEHAVATWKAIAISEGFGYMHEH